MRRPQLRGAFTPSDPYSGYYNDLRIVAAEHGSPPAAAAAFHAMTADRIRANPVSIAQLGLGAWQLAATDEGWTEVVRLVAAWIAADAGDDGLVPYRFAMPHTYELPAPWPSAMAQGEAASLLVRASRLLGDSSLLDAAVVVAAPLVDEGSRLVASTPDGPVLQEYPTEPPAHVLNGWIFALWGLYDVSLAAGSERCAAAFDAGVAAVAARLPRYSTGWGWSRYDLFPHRLVHVASPFYHRLHIEQLAALHALRPVPALAAVAGRWEAGARNPLARAHAVARKVAFRLLEPRRALPSQRDAG